jgi:predicted transcriptional regulator YdeE/predicted TPR repeat methyltransferase
MIPRIVTLEEKRLVGICRTMSFADNQTSALWREFMPRRHEIVAKNSDLFSVQHYADGFFEMPNSDMPFEKCAAIETDGLAVPQGMQSYIIPGGLYAVFDYKGSNTEAAGVFRHILGVWLPSSPFALDNRPHFEVLGEKYRNNDPASEEEIWIPIREKAVDKTKTAVAIFDKMAAHYQNRFADVSLYADSLSEWYGLLKHGANVLELACGPGNVTRYLLDRRPDLDIFGTDLSPAMVSLAMSVNPESRFGILDCRDVASYPQEIEGIICAFGLPYLSKTEAAAMVADAAHRLAKGGALYLSTMEGTDAQSGWEIGSGGDAMFMNYHEAGHLLAAMRENGMSIVAVERITYPGKGRTVTDLILIAQKP